MAVQLDLDVRLPWAFDVASEVCTSLERQLFSSMKLESSKLRKAKRPLEFFLHIIIVFHVWTSKRVVEKQCLELRQGAKNFNPAFNRRANGVWLCSTYDFQVYDGGLHPRLYYRPRRARADKES